MYVCFSGAGELECVKKVYTWVCTRLPVRARRLIAAHAVMCFPRICRWCPYYARVCVVNCLQAVLCAALYPNVVIATQQGPRCTYRTKKDGEVSLHPSSINASTQRPSVVADAFGNTHVASQYMIYLEKASTSHIITSLPLFGFKMGPKLTS